MCNLYRQRTGPQAIMDVANAMRSTVGNLAPGDIYPDYSAPIVRTDANGVRELALARWGLPSSKKTIFDNATKRADKLRAKGGPVDFQKILEFEPDSGTTNVRNTSSSHWKPWLEPAPLPRPLYRLQRARPPWRSQDQDRNGDYRRLRLSDDRAQRAGEVCLSEGYAGDPDTICRI